MIVISDTSPINYLILIDCIEILPQLYDKVTIPNSVFKELNHLKTPEKVKNWIVSKPDWLGVSTMEQKERYLAIGEGESDAIALALALNADLILLDDAEARQVAIENGLTITGTLGVLVSGSKANLIDLSDAVNKLRLTSCRISEKLLEAILQQNKPEDNI